MSRKEFVKILEEYRAEKGEIEFWACVAGFGCAEECNNGQLVIYTDVQTDAAFKKWIKE